MVNIMRDLKGVVPFQPWAAALYQQRQANKLRDNPRIQCLPAGVPRLDAYSHPYKIVQTSDLIVILYESQTMFRQIFTDGSAHPKDPEPSWLGIFRRQVGGRHAGGGDHRLQRQDLA